MDISMPVTTPAAHSATRSLLRQTGTAWKIFTPTFVTLSCFTRTVPCRCRVHIGFSLLIKRRPHKEIITFFGSTKAALRAARKTPAPYFDNVLFPHKSLPGLILFEVDSVIKNEGKPVLLIQTAGAFPRQRSEVW